MGILPTTEALNRAAEFGLDLVEVSSNSRPPVCRIMDFGKYKYELSKKDKLAKKKQHTFQMKEMRFRPKIEEHDYQFKTKHVRAFVESGNKVKVFVIFRGREMAHTEYGQKILDRVMEDMEDIAIVDVKPKLEGRNLSMIISPKPEVLKKVQTEKGTKKKKSDEPDETQVPVEDKESEQEEQVDRNI